MNTYSIFKHDSTKGWEFVGITIKAKDCYKAETMAIEKFHLEGIFIAMNESMLLLDNCIN